MSKRLKYDAAKSEYSSIGNRERIRYTYNYDKKEFKEVERYNIQELIQSAYKLSDSDIESIIQDVSTGIRALDRNGNYYDTTKIPETIYEARENVDSTARELYKVQQANSSVLPEDAKTKTVKIDEKKEE